MTRASIRRIIPIATVVIMGSVVVGCAAGPRYRPPQVTAPSAYKEEPAGHELQPAAPRDHLPRRAWWELFGDPRLNELELQLIRGNPTLAQAEARFRQARAVVRQDRAGYYPTVGDAGSMIRTRPGSNGVGVAARSPLSELSESASLSWEPDFWGRVRQNVAAGTASAQAAAADLENTRLSLAVQLAANYFQVRSLDAELTLFAQTIEAYNRAATLTRNKYEAGVVSRADVEQAETQLASAQAQAIDVQLQRAVLEHAIAVLVGESPAAVSLAAWALDFEPPNVPADVPSRLLERRPDIAAAERGVAAANAQVGVASTAFFPSVALGATGGFQGGRLQQWLTWPMRFWSVGPTLALTIFDGGARRAAKAAATANYDETVAAYRQAVLSAFQDVEDDLAAQRLLAQEAERQRAAVAAAQRSLEISLNQYRAGLVDYLQVATQQAALLTNQRAELAVTARRFSAAVGLIGALGGGWDGDLQKVSER
jgi:NodT family efflux transporter outer membrane factor (OMF) lipoprotein